MSGYGHKLVPPPVWWPAMRAGETDGRYLDTTPDLGAVGDTILGINTVTVTIVRADGEAITDQDLQEAGTAWPNTLDETGLIPTIGLIAPTGAAGVTYAITLTVNGTAQGRVFIRDTVLTVAATLG